MIGVVRIKAGVRLDPLTPALARILCGLDMSARMMGSDIMVSCGREDHSSEDVHTVGGAVDVSVKDYSPEMTVRLFQYLARILGDLFTVLYETPLAPTNGSLLNIATVNPHATAPHFHVQRKKGTIYPPMEDMGRTA